MLKPLQAMYPLGQFDGYDSQLTSFKGGEVCTFVGVVNTVATDKAASDVFDGYYGVTTTKRPAVTFTLGSGNRPLFLADDGTTGYGTLFGLVVGGSVGTDVAGVTVGPHTALASGKITLWDKEGLYAVTLDAVDTTASTGLTPTNTTLNCGDKLYATTAGLLTPNTSAKFEDIAIARFVEFTTNGSLVSTPNTLVAALNSPSGGVSSLKARAFSQAIVWYAGANGGA